MSSCPFRDWTHALFTSSNITTRPTGHNTLFYKQKGKLCCYVWTSLYYTDTSDCIVSYLFLPNTEAHVRYDLMAFFCTIWSRGCLGTIWSPDSYLYDIYLGAMHTMILSIRDIQIPINLVSSAMDSIRRRVVLFKPVRIPTSDPKSEFL